jgi:hypothetical protein
VQGLALIFGCVAGALARRHDIDAVIAENALKLATSASRGTLSRISVSSVSRPAIINGSAAFLAPEIGIVPLSLRRRRCECDPCRGLFAMAALSACRAASQVEALPCADRPVWQFARAKIMR